MNGISTNCESFSSVFCNLSFLIWFDANEKNMQMECNNNNNKQQMKKISYNNSFLMLRMLAKTEQKKNDNNKISSLSLKIASKFVGPILWNRLYVSSDVNNAQNHRAHPIDNILINSIIFFWKNCSQVIVQIDYGFNWKVRQEFCFGYFVLCM